MTVSKVPFVLNKNTAPAPFEPVSSPDAPIRTRSPPSVATAPPKKSLLEGIGLVNVVSKVPFVLNRYAAPAPGAPMTTRPVPSAATASPNTSLSAGVGLVKVVIKLPFVAKRYAPPDRNAALPSHGALT